MLRYDGVHLISGRADLPRHHFQHVRKFLQLNNMTLLLKLEFPVDKWNTVIPRRSCSCWQGFVHLIHVIWQNGGRRFFVHSDFGSLIRQERYFARWRSLFQRLGFSRHMGSSKLAHSRSSSGRSLKSTGFVRWICGCFADKCPLLFVYASYVSQSILSSDFSSFHVRLAT